ncbi:MAG: acetyl-CoA carboxylase biotin carboxyl carrier protein [Bacteroidota bacterium]|nr:acetyl-CoA carboxylase biotin carboxyl carrier protein [Bacteroidota bacterium]
MDLNYLKKITKILAESNVDEIEIEEEGLKIRVARHSQNSGMVAPAPQQYVQSIVPAVQERQIPVSTAPHQPLAPVIIEKKYTEIKSPIVGTFYRAPSPDADSYVEVGRTINKGDVLCIIEAMKLMNEIESDISGTIVKIIAENAQPVEYNQVLFLIDPS